MKRAFILPIRVAMDTKRDNSTEEREYVHLDHQGSIDVITKSDGAVKNRMAYHPFGKTYLATWVDSAVGITDQVGLRGYTGHEILAQMGFIHMNGRVYDPNVGRFLSADPMVQFPEYSDGFNRYSYVLNNPMSFTDSSGYSLDSFMREVIPTVITIGMYAAAAGAGPLGAFAVGYITGYVFSGGNAEVALQSGAMAFISAGMFTAAGGIAESLSNPLGQMAVHGAAGGVMSAMRGGKFSEGFMTAALTKGAAGFINANIDVLEGRVLASAIVGGTVAEMSGGKFANGAITAVFSRLFNDEYHRRDVDYIWDGTSGPGNVYNYDVYVKNGLGEIVDGPFKGSLEGDPIHRPACTSGGCPPLMDGKYPIKAELGTYENIKNNNMQKVYLMLRIDLAATPTRFPNPAQSGFNYSKGTWVHMGYQYGTYAEGCATVHYWDYAKFISNFREGTIGTLTISSGSSSM